MAIEFAWTPLRRRYVQLLRGLWAGVVVVGGCTQGEPPMPPSETTPPASEDGAREVAVYALSRGKGVPDATREAREKARALFEELRTRKLVLDIQETRVGIEGERRICAVFGTARDAADAVKQLRALAEGVELFNIVLEPCTRPPGPEEQKQGETP